MDVKNIVRLDIIEGKPRTFVYDKNLENGFFLENLAGNILIIEP